VIKVVWGKSTGTSCWPVTRPVLLRKRMMECVDGEYQAFKARDGAYVRKHFFGKYPELAEDGVDLVMSDEQIYALQSRWP
jgi:pyruvate dehydrogenase E1 component